MVLDSGRVIHGYRAKIYFDGEEMTNASECTAKVAIDKKDIQTIGNEWTGYKGGVKKGTGNFSGFKVTSALLQHGFEKFEIIVSLEDPESYGTEQIRLKNVFPDELMIVNLKVGDIVTEEMPFTFEGYELINPIVAED